MEYFLAIIILIIGHSQHVQLSEGTGVVYYVLPTKPLSSCSGNSSCPSGQLCLTMDYLVEHSSEFFSPDYVNITLLFMCGVHNLTKDLSLQNLHSFVMEAATETKENIIIDMLSQVRLQNDTYTFMCTQIDFINVSFVRLTTLTLRCPSISVEGSFATIENSILFGNKNTSEFLSTLTFRNRDSKAVLDNCTFKENCFVVSNMSAGIRVNNCTFHSYRHEYGSMIVAYSSVITLNGYVNFSHGVKGIHRGIYSSGAAVFLKTTPPEQLKSWLYIKEDASVYFTNLSCSVSGGAVYAENAVINISARATIVFMHNKASSLGGAICLNNTKMNVGNNSRVEFAHNSGCRDGGGAIGLVSTATLTINSDARVSFYHNTAYSNPGGAIAIYDGTLNISTNASVTFSHNSAVYSRAGALYLYNATIHVDTDVFFNNNTAIRGGAIHFYYGKMYINVHAVVQFIANTAQLRGGAIYIEAGDHSSIIIDNFATLHFADNSAFQGGALYVIPSSFAIEVKSESNTEFVNNTATDVGGAVYCEVESASPCIFLVTDYSAQIAFIGNSAHRSIGHHIYGSSIKHAKCDGSHLKLLLANEQGKPYTTCDKRVDNHVNFSLSPDLNETLSPVSSAPWRVCLCDSNGRPQCANMSRIFTNVSVNRGETFTLSMIAVGYDFGTTVGSVYSKFIYSNHCSKLEQSQYNQLVNSSQTCTSLNYTIYTKDDNVLLQLQTSALPVPVYVNKDNINYYVSKYKTLINNSINLYNKHGQFGCIDEELLTTPIFIGVTLLPGCPPGLTLRDDATRCCCYSILATNGFQCTIRNQIGYLKWNTTMWVNATYNESQTNGIIYNLFCPQQYCKQDEKMLNIKDDSSKQCASNRTGILCGACMENFSLAIGSSRCIECHNSHNVALLVIFAAAGVFLVFFILALNLTVTQGLINGLIFHVNIMWAYKIILFPSAEVQDKYLFYFLQVFVAWLNLDFGIETCFFSGLNAYQRTWLQFLFPIYIWAIAGVIIVACRHSSRLTNLIGSRAVPLLATLFLLSYMKLLRTIIDAISVAVITQYPQNISYAVWYLDGNLRYCQYPHIYLFIAAIIALLVLWLPYTLLLLFIQPLRRVSHLRPLKWINRLAPVYDAYLSPLKNKHQYWFGTMLFVRGLLLIILTASPMTNPEINVFILSVMLIILIVLLSIKNVYKQRMVRILEGANFMNLLVLSAGTLYKWESTKSKIKLLEVSIGFAFAQFCIIVVWSLVKPCYGTNTSWRCRRKQIYDVINEDDFTHERVEDPELEAVHAIAPANNTATITY